MRTGTGENPRALVRVLDGVPSKPLPEPGPLSLGNVGNGMPHSRSPRPGIPLTCCHQPAARPKAGGRLAETKGVWSTCAALPAVLCGTPVCASSQLTLQH